MRFATILPTIILTGGLAAAQTAVNPNAIGLWRSDNLTIGGLGITNINPGNLGWYAWTVLPPDVLTYFRSQTVGGQRQLDFRGIEFLMTVPTAGIGKSHTIPKIEIRRAVQAPTPNQGRWVPGAKPADLYLTYNPLVLGNQPTAGTFDFNYVLATSVAVGAGDSAGSGLCARFVDYQSQWGGATSLYLMRSTTESAPLAGSGTLSGITIPGTTPTNAWLDTAFANMTTSEFIITFYFNQSMISPIKNAQQLAGGAILPGGGTLPPGLDPSSGGFAIQADDGRGALAPHPGDVVSWSVNSNYGGALGPSGAGSVWLVPFVMFEGDIAPGIGPLPENWVGNNAIAQPSYIWPVPLQSWLDFVGLLLGAGPGLGGQINPNNSTLGPWLGADPANPTFLDPNVLLNSFAFSNILGGIAFGGPELTMFDAVANPTGIMARNLSTGFGGMAREFKSLLTPQTGFTPIVGATTAPFIGIDYPVTAPNPAAGKAFYVTCWVMDLASPTNPFGFNILDMTSTLKITLQQ